MHQALVLLALSLLGPEQVQGAPDRETASAKPEGPIWSPGGDGDSNGTGVLIVNGNMGAFNTGSSNVGAGNGNLNRGSVGGNGNAGAGKDNFNGNQSLSLFRW